MGMWGSANGGNWNGGKWEWGKWEWGGGIETGQTGQMEMEMGENINGEK